MTPKFPFFGSSRPNPPEKIDWSALSLIDRGGIAIGEVITSERCLPGHMLALLEGRIRLLEIADDGEVRTRALLEPGDLWDEHAWRDEDVIWSVSEPGRLAALSAEDVERLPFLLTRAEQSRRKIEDTTPAAPESRSFPGALPNSLPGMASPNAAPPPDTDADSPLTVRDVFDCLHLECPSDLTGRENPADDEPVLDLETLRIRLLSHGLRGRIVSLNWPQMQKTPPPWVLEDHTGRLVCVVGIRHHEILARSGGRPASVSIERRGGQKSWRVLLLQPAASDSSRPARPLPWQTPFTLTWYATLLLKHFLVSGQMLAASLMTQIFALGMPVFYMVIFDRVFGRQNLDTLDVMAIGMGLVLLSDLVVRGIRSLMLTHLLVWVDRVGAETVTEHLFRLPPGRIGRERLRQCGELYADLIRANEAVVSLFLVSSLDAAFSGVMIFVLFSLHWQMALVSLAPMVPLILLTAIATPQVRKRARVFSGSQRAAQVCLSETLEHWETLHAANALEPARDRLRQITRQMLGSNLWSRFDSVSGNSLSSFIGNVGSLATLYFGAHEVLQGNISYGAYAAINMMSRSVVGSMQKLLAAFLRFQENTERLEKYRDLVRETLQPATEASFSEDRPRLVLPTLKGEVGVRGLRFRYPNDTAGDWLLGPVNLTIPAGQKVVLTGAAGSGKTTLIRMIQGLYAPTEGSITVDGYRLNELDPVTRHRLIGVALQKPAFLSGSVLDNLTLEDPDAPMKDVLDAVRLAQLDGLLDKLPNGLDATIAPMAANLPPTLATRLALARVFISRPSILIIDKAMDTLEPAVQAAIFSPMLQIYRQSTCILATDFLPVHQKADRIIVMKDGVVVEDGPFRDLIRTKGYYYHLHVVDKTFTKQ